MAVNVYIHRFDCFNTLNGSSILSVSSVNEKVVTVLENVVGISHTYLPIQIAISFFMDACDQAPLILPKMQDQKSFTLL